MVSSAAAGTPRDEEVDLTPQLPDAERDPAITARQRGRGRQRLLFFGLSGTGKTTLSSDPRG